MTDEDFYHTCAIRAMEILLSKIPVPSLPGGNQDQFARQQFVRGLARDSFEVAIAMLQEKRLYPLPIEPAGRPLSAYQVGALTGLGEGVRIAEVQVEAAGPNVTPG